MKNDVALSGVVVTFHPDEAVFDNLRHMVVECGRLIIVDNGSAPELQDRLSGVEGAELIAFAENRGVAAALNAGAGRAIESGCRWVVAFDQDSRPQTGMVEALQATAVRQADAAIVVPRILEPGDDDRPYRWVRAHPRWPGLFQRVSCDTTDLPAVTLAITSGSLFDLAVWRDLGAFDEALFIDYVDIDYCLKVVRAGRRVAVSADAWLIHELGARGSREWLGHDFRPMNHAAFRHYYMARNRVRVWGRHAWAVPHWALFDAGFAVYNSLRVLAWEKERGLKMKAILLGTWDGLRRKTGPCPEQRWKQLADKQSRRGPHSC